MVDFESAQATRDGITMWMERIQAESVEPLIMRCEWIALFFFFIFQLVRSTLWTLSSSLLILLCVVFVCEFLCAPAFGRLGADTNEKRLRQFNKIQPFFDCKAKDVCSVLTGAAVFWIGPVHVLMMATTTLSPPVDGVHCTIIVIELERWNY